MQRTKSKKNLKKALFLLFNALMIVGLITALEGQWKAWGVLAYLFIVMIMPIWRLFRGGFIKNALEGIETAIWGKPLKKELWEKGEMKNTKLKMGWKRKNDTKNIKN